MWSSFLISCSAVVQDQIKKYFNGFFFSSLILMNHIKIYKLEMFMIEAVTKSQYK